MNQATTILICTARHMKKINKITIFLITLFVMLIFAFFDSIYDVIKYVDAPFSIYDEISYIEKNILKNKENVSYEKERKLSLYILDYCDFPVKWYYSYVNLIYPRSYKMDKYKKKFMKYAINYRINHPIDGNFFEKSTPDLWRERVEGCWRKIFDEYHE